MERRGKQYSRQCGGLRKLDGVRHGFWMRKLRVAESRICNGIGGFGLGDETDLAAG